MTKLKCWKNVKNEKDFKLWKNTTNNKDVAIFRNSVVIGSRRFITNNQSSALKRVNKYMKKHDKC